MIEKKYSLFQCELCGAEHKIKDDALNCEKSHIKVNAFLGQDFVCKRGEKDEDLKNTFLNNYPISVKVRTSDDTELIYYREDIMPD